MGLFKSKLSIGRDDRGYVTNEISWPSLEQSQKITLSTGAEQTIAVPTWAYRVKFTVGAGGSVWCGYGATPLVLSTGSFANEQSELNPIVRPVFDSDGERISTLRFLSENDTFINVIFYTRNDSDVTK